MPTLITVVNFFGGQLSMYKTQTCLYVVAHPTRVFIFLPTIDYLTLVNRSEYIVNKNVEN